MKTDFPPKLSLWSCLDIEAEVHSEISLLSACIKAVERRQSRNVSF